MKSITKEYVEQVLDKQSTHIVLRMFIPDIGGNIVVGDLIIKEGEEIKEILATDRYYSASMFSVTEEDFRGE